MVLKMKDIAKLANVSTSAVSLAINGKPGISQETREKIFKVINENEYQPLRKRRKGGVRKVASCDLIIVSDKKGVVNRNYRSLPFFDYLVSTLSQNINGFGTNLRIDTLRIRHLVEDLNELLTSTAVTNAIVLGTDLSKSDIELINSKIKHTVFVDTYFKEIKADFVTIDNFQGTYEAAKYILSKGYKNIGYASSSKANPNFLKRREGFQAALKEENIDIVPNHFYSIEPINLIPTTPLQGFSLDNLPEVIFCETDYMAIRIMKECIKNGIKVPEDIAIMGFDDIEEDVLINPELTTVHVSIDQIVDQAIFQLQSQVSLGENWEPQKSLVGTHLVIRKSV